MSSKGIYLAQEAHFVNVLPPVDIAGGAVGDRFHMKKHGHVTLLVAIGVSAAAFTKIIVKEADAATAGNTSAIPYRLHAEETAAGDTLGSQASIAATGKTPSANDNIMYVIEIDASELSDGYEWVEVSLTNASGNSVLASVLAILTGPRYAGDQDATAIA